MNLGTLIQKERVLIGWIYVVRITAVVAFVLALAGCITSGWQVLPYLYLATVISALTIWLVEKAHKSIYYLTLLNNFEFLVTYNSEYYTRYFEHITDTSTNPSYRYTFLRINQLLNYLIVKCNLNDHALSNPARSWLHDYPFINIVPSHIGKESPARDLAVLKEQLISTLNETITHYKNRSLYSRGKTALSYFTRSI